MMDHAITTGQWLAMMNHAMTAGQWLAIMASSNDPCSVGGEIPCAVEIPLICMTHRILA